MIKKPTIGLGVLSWRGYDSLSATLSSYHRENLFSLFDQSLVFLPQIEDKGRAIAKAYGLECAGHEKNLGILGGFEAMAQALHTDYILLCENDYALIEPYAQAQAQIERGLSALTRGDAVVWRFRHRQQAGDVWHVHKAHRYWPPTGASPLQQVLASLRRALRPNKAKKFIGYRVFYHDDCHLLRPDLVKQTQEGDYLVRSDAMPWSNNPFLINRQFFLDVILKAARDNTAKRTINGFPTIETELNRGWWRQQKFWIGIANQGLFTHSRKGDRGY